jgi:hypothetical protein
MAENTGSKYRLYRLDGTGHISLAEWFDAENDQDAIHQAQFLRQGARKCEVWNGSRLVVQLADGEVRLSESAAQLRLIQVERQHSAS